VPVAVVTGAAGGIGSAVRAALAGAGYDVVAADLPGVDVRDPAAVARLPGDADVLVNCAGIYGERTPFVSSDPELWWQVVETNLRGAALCTRHVLPTMVSRGSGYVINVNSRAAVWDDPSASSVAYSVSKAALARFTSAVAAEVAGTGVVVVDLSPGPVLTGMTASRPDAATRPANAWLPASLAADKVVQLVSGRYDELHGRFVHARDDLDELVRRVAADPAARRLSLGL
jgi:3-oxoacyl-[acyl-carrier protein] reductase